MSTSINNNNIPTNISLRAKSKNRTHRGKELDGNEQTSINDSEDDIKEELTELQILIMQSLAIEGGSGHFDQIYEHVSKKYETIRRRDGTPYTSDCKRAISSSLSNNSSAPFFKKENKKGNWYWSLTKKAMDFLQEHFHSNSVPAIIVPTASVIPPITSHNSSILIQSNTSSGPSPVNNNIIPTFTPATSPPPILNPNTLSITDAPKKSPQNVTATITSNASIQSKIIPLTNSTTPLITNSATKETHPSSSSTINTNAIQSTITINPSASIVENTTRNIIPQSVSTPLPAELQKYENDTKNEQSAISDAINGKDNVSIHREEEEEEEEEMIKDEVEEEELEMSNNKQELLKISHKRKEPNDKQKPKKRRK